MLKINIGQQVLYLLPQKNIKEIQAAGALGPILKWIEMPNLKEHKDKEANEIESIEVKEIEAVEFIAETQDIEIEAKETEAEDVEIAEAKATEAKDINIAKEIATAKMLDIIQELESFSPTDGFKIAIVAYAKNFKKLVQIFKSFYKVQEAAGGLVRQTETGKILAIFRRGHWDMAKGKTEKNESIEQTAVREVQEETGVQNIDLQDFITTTYHTYNGNTVVKNTGQVRRRMLKVSHWYHMQTPDVALVPQTEEDIEGIEWLEYFDFLQKRPIFTNILDVLHLAIDKFSIAANDESIL
jgi:8-oxo-dGTP pyrophosphatase MutT (NUDIX family)